jgi:hypothetical protein
MYWHFYVFIEAVYNFFFSVFQKSSSLGIVFRIDSLLGLQIVVSELLSAYDFDIELRKDPPESATIRIVSPYIVEVCRFSD